MNRHARSRRRKGIANNMKDVETITTAQAAAVAERGAHVAPEQAFLKEGATEKKGAPGGLKTASGGKSRAAHPKKAAKPSKNAGQSTRTKEASLRPESKGAKIPELIARQGSDPNRNPKRDRLAGP
jgi:hypothetical protein